MNGTDRRLAISAQTPPTGNGAIILEYVLDKIDGWMGNPSSEEREGLAQVREDLIARAETGLKKYGTYLRANNGRRATVDVYQEVMDALMYSMQARVEGTDTVAAGYVELFLELARQLAAELDKA
jgi:hypothetical protein